MRRITSTAAAVLAVALMIPGLGRAEVIAPECMLDGVNAAGAYCESSFDVTAAEAGYHVSLVGTHGGIHGYPSAGAHGRVSLQWFDGDGRVVAEWSCMAFANNADYLPFELTRAPACSEIKSPPATLPVGTSTMKATILEIANPGANGSRLHGRIVLRGADFPV